MKLSEFDLIKRARELFKASPEVALPIGDDVAVVKLGNKLVFTGNDALAEGSHYLRSWKERIPHLYRLLGKKLLNVTVSDFASTGGTPKFALLTVCLEESTSDEAAVELLEGIAEEAQELGIAVVGGDTVKGKGEVFELSLLGEGNSFMARKGARPGELVGVTGTLGDARGGLELLLEERKPLKEIFRAKGQTKGRTGSLKGRG